MSTDPLEPHPLVRLLGKSQHEFNAEDLVRAAEQLSLKQLNLRYVAGDGRLKTIAFAVRSLDHLREVLVRGERVDGSSVFAHASTTESDLYLVPRHATAFLDPFSEGAALDVLCSLYDREGDPLRHAADHVLRRSAEALRTETGMTLEAFGELEFYLVDTPDDLYAVEEEHGYQESAPFSKSREVREEVITHLATMGIRTKYAHGEVGNSRSQRRQLTQHEIELWPEPVEQAADALVLAKWVVREVAYRHGVEAVFAPSVDDDGAGSGLHVHSRLVRDGENVLVAQDGLADTARLLIAGYLTSARALTALGNTVPTSYLRLADGEESPEGICWGETDRTGLVRVPLAWLGDVVAKMSDHANPGSMKSVPSPAPHPQTVELRVADGSADVHLYLAAMTMAALSGLQDPDGLDVAERLSTARGSDFEQLPSSCAESADALEDGRATFERHDVFPATLLDSIVGQLRARHHGAHTSSDGDDESSRARHLIVKYWHVG